MHILIVGKRGVGKTTLIRRLVRPEYGFFTRKERPWPDGNAPVYLHSFTEPLSCTARNLVGLCRAQRAVKYPEVFDTEGVRVLRKIPQGAMVVLDELGFLENDAAAFQARVKALLDGDYRVIAAVKDKVTPFLEQVRQHPRCRVYFITEENRTLLPAIITAENSWLRESAR